MTQKLPIQTVLPDIQSALSQGTPLVLSAPPGSGKTTGVPLALLDEPWLAGKKILMLEPRRMAARAAAERMAHLLAEEVGQTVGYRIRMESRISAATRIEIVTEGILTRYLQRDPILSDVGIVIFDEFHERSIHADLGLALCLDARTVREDLRILVMSATLDTKAVSKILGNAPVVTGEGKMFPVEIRHVAPKGRDLAADTAAALLSALKEETGSALVFLPGAREIRQVHRRLSESGCPVPVFPLFGALGRHAQDNAIAPAPSGSRKIVLATDIAETSLTIEGIRIVIDAGRMRVPRFDARCGMTKLVTLPVSKASADQRAGRAGRLSPGVCYRLWARESHAALLDQASPEITCVDLASLALELAAWGATASQLSWLDPPPEGPLSQAVTLLQDLGALDETTRITAHGKEMSALGLHPRLAHMILAAKRHDMGGLACTLAAILGERDFRLPGFEGKDSDLRSRMDALRAFAGHRESRGVDPAACRTILKISDLLKTRTNTSREPEDMRHLGIVLSFAYPDRIAIRRPGNDPRFLLSNGRGAYFSSPESLSAEDYLVIAELDGAERESRIFAAAPIAYDDLAVHQKDRISRQEIVTWDSRTQAVLSRRQTLLGKAVLKDAPLQNPPPGKTAGAMCEGIREMGLDPLPWSKELRAWRARVQFMKNVNAEGLSWPDLSDAHLLSSLEEWLLPFLNGITRGSQFSRIDLAAALKSLLPWREGQALERLAPTHFAVPSGSRIPIDYENTEAPVLAVRLQEMFGAEGTPSIAGGKIPLLVHLLSPAGRPVQITKDLKSFWEAGYFEVRKDLRGRYPKHHWPDNPLEAPPTNRIKKRSPGPS